MWLRERPVVGDALLALLVLVLDGPAALGSADPRIGVGVGLLLGGPLVLRRTHPPAAALLVLVGGAAQLVLQQDVVLRPGDMALAIALYTLVSYVGRRTALWYAVALTAGTVTWSVLRAGDVFAPVLPVLGFSLAWTLAEFVGARRAYDAEVQARLATADTDRDRRAEVAVAAERTRIARELHDVVAHAVSVMVVQADGASYALARQPESAAAALSTISDTGRQALAELRRTLLLLRGPETGTDLTPVPGSAGLGQLVARMRSVGLPVQLELVGDVDGLPAGIGLGVHRIVQESLTNVLRHAGQGATAQVCVQRREADVCVQVRDGGGARPAYQGGSGNGLLGMRERVTVLDGTLEAGPHQAPGGSRGWQVSARIPLG